MNGRYHHNAANYVILRYHNSINQRIIYHTTFSKYEDGSLYIILKLSFNVSEASIEFIFLNNLKSQWIAHANEYANI